MLRDGWWLFNSPMEKAKSSSLSTRHCSNKRAPTGYQEKPYVGEGNVNHSGYRYAVWNDLKQSLIIHSYSVIWMTDNRDSHLLLVSAKIKQEIHYQLHQSLLNNCRTEDSQVLENKLLLNRHYIGIECLLISLQFQVRGLKFSPSPFFGPLIPSSAARSDGWRLNETSSFSLKRIATDSC